MSRLFISGYWERYPCKASYICLYGPKVSNSFSIAHEWILHSRVNVSELVLQRKKLVLFLHKSRIFGGYSKGCGRWGQDKVVWNSWCARADWCHCSCHGLIDTCMRICLHLAKWYCAIVCSLYHITFFPFCKILRVLFKVLLVQPVPGFPTGKGWICNKALLLYPILI